MSPGSVTYTERRLAPGVVLWRSHAAAAAAATAPVTTTILPDGCLDLVFDGTTLAVAGPDSGARRHSATGVHVGVRFSHGAGPLAVGVPADAVRDSTVDLAALWGDRRARELSARVADDPAGALAAWAAATPVDPFGAAVFTALARGTRVAAVAESAGVGERTLHRRCRPVFGYGPQHLGRVLRLQGALAGARAGRSWATVAADAGYSDQPHLVREVRALTGSTPTALLAQGAGSGANRSTGTPSGSRTTA